jgi:hypothetical protein
MYFIIQFHFHLSFARIREFNLEVQHYVIQECLRFRSFSFTPRLQPLDNSLAVFRNRF